MTFIWAGITVLLFFATMLLLFYFFGKAFEENKYDYWALISGIFLVIATYFAADLTLRVAKREDAKPVIISTATPPRIDTTIAITNGVADTTYTYYIIRK